MSRLIIVKKHRQDPQMEFYGSAHATYDDDDDDELEFNDASTLLGH